jgi:hypothetical protein
MKRPCLLGAQVVTLFRRYPNDPLILKAVVLFSFIVDTACTIAECATVYTYTVTFWGNPAGLANQIWAGPAYVFTTALSAAIVHAFLIFRFYTLSKQTALAVLLVCFALAAVSPNSCVLRTACLRVRAGASFRAACGRSRGS